jgi:hypothetical protein
MGCCSSKNVRIIHSPKTPLFNNATSEGIDDDDPENSYKFTVKLSGFVVRGPETNGTPCWLKIVWGRKPFVFKTEESTTLKWSDTYEFGYSASLDNLEKESMQVIFYSKSTKEPESQAIVAILDFAVGPVHQDFVLVTKHSKIFGRCGFDVEMR